MDGNQGHLLSLMETQTRTTLRHGDTQVKVIQVSLKNFQTPDCLELVGSPPLMDRQRKQRHWHEKQREIEEDSTQQATKRKCRK